MLPHFGNFIFTFFNRRKLSASPIYVEEDMRIDGHRQQKFRLLEKISLNCAV